MADSTASAAVPGVAAGSETGTDTESVYTQDLGDQVLQSQWLPDSWQPALDLVGQYPLIGALAVVTAAYVLALGTRLIFVLASKLWAGRDKNAVDAIVLRELRRPVFTTTFAVGLVLAVRISTLPAGKPLLINLLSSAIIITWMLAGFRLSGGILGAASANPRFALVEPRTIPLFDLAAKLSLLLLSSYALLLVWGINPVGWLASAGIVGIAIGFAAKDTLANLFSGLFILADAPYKIGDFINLDSGERGQVTAIGMRSTRLLTRSDVEITVPNAVIGNAKITNESGGRHQKMRIQLPVSVAYGSDVDEVENLLQSLAENHGEACTSPAPRVRIRAFGASGIDFELLAWIEQPEDLGRISHELFRDIYKAFGARGIEIPYSKQDLYIKELPAGSAAHQSSQGDTRD